VRARLGGAAILLLSATPAIGQTLHLEARLDAPAPIRSAATCERGARVVGIGEDGAIYTWSLPSGTAQKISVPDGFARKVACAGDTLAVGLRREPLLLDAESGNVRRRIETKEPVQAMAFSPDGSLLAFATLLTPTQLWDTRSGQRLAVGVTSKGASYGAAFSPDGKVLVSADQDTRLRAYDRKGKLLYAVDAGLLEPFAVAFTADGKQFAVAGAEGAVVLHEAASGKRVRSSINSGRAIVGLTMSPDGKSVAALELDNFTLAPLAVALWDMQSTALTTVPVDANSVIGAGPGKSHLLLVRKDGAKALSVSSIQ
jgi:WD40 repeat protein